MTHLLRNVKINPCYLAECIHFLLALDVRICKVYFLCEFVDLGKLSLSAVIDYLSDILSCLVHRLFQYVHDMRKGCLLFRCELIGSGNILNGIPL